jgi:hypothetical protein
MILRGLVFFLFAGILGSLAPSFAGASITKPEILCIPDYKPINDSTIDGKYRQYNDGHQLVFEGKYKGGLRHGIFKEYDGSGLLTTKAKYKRGKLKWKQLYRNGKIYAVIDKKGVYRKRKDCGC